MRPIKLTITAFGPYRDTEIIDFNELNGRNLFLITGQTGSGKTTIFDALSFALYGESSGNERSPESLRSHFASDDVLTEVSLEFELKGNFYFIKRIPKQNKPKSRGEGFTEQKSDGELIIYGKKISDENKKVITGVKAINEKIEELLGINGEQFRQIMMIPQGEFRKLLTSDSQDREKILQKLFNTEIYNLIQSKLDRDFKDVSGKIKKRIELIDYEIKKIDYGDNQLLKENIEKENRNFLEIVENLNDFIIDDSKELKNLEKEILGLNKVLEENITLREQAKTINEKIMRKNEIQNILKEKELELSDISLKKEKASKGEKALLISGIYDNYSLRKNELKLKRIEFENIQLKIVNQKKVNEGMEKEFLFYNSKEQEKVREKNSDDIAILKSYEGKVKKLEILSKEIYDIETRLKKIKKTHEDEKNKIEIETKKLEVLNNEMDKSRKAKVEFLEKREIYLRKENIHKEIKKVIGIYNDFQTQFKNHMEAKTEKENFEDRVKDEERKYKEKKIIFLMNQAANLAKDLKDGMPCPVCGSIDHMRPAEFSGENISEKDIEYAENNLSKLIDEYNEKKNSLSVIFERMEITRKSLEDAINSMEVFDEVPLLEISYDSGTKELKRIFYDSKESLSRLSEEILDLQKEMKREDALEKDILNANENLENLRSSLEDISNRLINENLILSEKKTMMKEIENEIPEKIRNINSLNSEIAVLENLRGKLMEKFNNSRKNFEDSKDKLRDFEIQKNEIIKTISQGEEIVSKTLVQLKDKIHENGFLSIEDYLSSRMNKKDIDEINIEVEDYFNEIRSLKDRSDELKRELENLEYKDLEIFESVIRENKERNDLLSKTLRIIESRIKNNQLIIKNISELGEEQKNLEKEYNILGRLAKTSKGENSLRITFERYVLAAFFEDVIKAANMRFSKMTDGRYRMARSEELERLNKQSGLEIEVYDSYTGKHRHVKTLSGGESFKASLSMALGLSDVVQSYAGGVQLDTMFIDEGFGTLDEESLESAINTLIDLQKTGRLIGIISHVQELKERIDIRLEITGSSTGSHGRFVGM